MKTSYLFVDGASFGRSLQDISKDYFNGADLEVNWSKFRSGFRKVFYYDAIPVQEDGESEEDYSERIGPKTKFLDNVERQSGFHVRTGDVRRRRTRGNEQKMVDVQLSVDSLLWASRGLFSECTIYTGDLDFRPLVVALVDMGIDVSLHYPPNNTNKYLLAAADVARPININSVMMFLNLSGEQRKRVPRTVSMHQVTHRVPDAALKVWQDEQHGDCYIMPENNEFKLVAERSRENPKTHNLTISSNELETLKLYAWQIHKIHVPD